MYSTRLHVYTRASLTDNLARILARKSARVGQVGGQVGEDRRACPARVKLNVEVAGHADILATILADLSADLSDMRAFPREDRGSPLGIRASTRVNVYCT